MSERGMQEAACEEIEKQASLYVFPGVSRQQQQQQYQGNTVSTLQLPPLSAPTILGSMRTNDVGEIKDIEDPSSRLRRRPYSKTHTRSASHGGVLASSSVTTNPITYQTSWQTPPWPTGGGSYLGPLPTLTGPIRPSALKKPGHQRAFSQGQVVDVQSQLPVSGHSRVGSRTDFILPPGHREESRPSTAGKVPSFRGHSRQASRSESIYTIRRSAAPPLWRRIWARYFGSLPDEPRLRTIVPNHLVPPRTSKSQHPNGGRVNNRIKTTKYTILNFIPRNLFEQCRRIANLYFIFIVLLNWVPDINAFGKEVAIIPVVFVLGVTALKDIFEDRRRSMSDRRINNSTCRVYVGEGGRYMQVAWKDVKVGDLVHLSNNEVVPADLLLLRSSDPQGLAYIDTCNLDGETNLKQRQVVRGFFELQDTFQPAKFRSMLEVDQPSTKINRFHGAVVHPNGGRVPVTIENLLLRECLLKNTDFIEGIVVYAGHETKAMLNNGGPRHKRSRLEKRMNCDIIWCMVILVKLCMIGAIGYRLWLSSFSSTILIPFLPVLQDPNYESMITFWTFVIILQVMIPLSLYVTIEMAKVGQIYHIGRDSFLYDKETGRRAECRALNITEELGQVQYIFSDKTGTLTENKMLFRRCAVGGQDYAHEGEGENLIPCPRLKEDLLIGTFRHRLQEFLIVLATCNTVVVNSQPHHDIMNSSGLIEEPHKNGSGPTRYERLSESRSVTPSPSPSIPPLPLPTPPASITGDSSSPISSIIDSAAVLNDPPKLQSKVVRPKLLNVTSIPSLSLGLLSRKQSPNGGQKRRNILSPIFDMSGKSVEQLTPTPAIYEAESPDELALVNAARAYDVKLLKRTPRNTIISLPDKSILSYEILYVLPFDSSRKCMSVVVRHPLTGEIILYSKGADTTVLASLTSSDENSMTSAKIRQQLNSYARQGLRTLVMARRSLTQQEYETWHEKHLEAELAIENRERRIRDSYASLENHMTLLGATGIEDKLQPGVPETITALVKAGIVVWVLTGDKPETAVNVAYSAGLFSPAMQLLQLQTRSKSVAETLIRGYLESAKRDNIMNDGVDNRNEDGIAMYSYDLTERDAHRIGSPWPRKRALVVDGKTLTVILDPRSGLTGPFLELTRTCSSVLACRATPLQKAYIVRIVKEQLRMRTLAIGDGANDVSMIQTADVGVGISGQEGRQAVMAADFAICRFYMLNRLLLLHGHWCYDRLSRMILYFFYKNATFVFLIFWFQFYCGFSGAVMIDQIYLMLYNLLFISLPPLVLGVYDRITTPNILLSMPELYKRGRLGLVYRPISFWITIADAFYESIVIFFTIFITYYDTTVDIWEFGTTITTACIFSMLLHVSIETRSWTIIHVLAIMGSLFIYMGFCLIYNAICINCMGLPGSFWIMEMAIRRHTYWLSVILTTVLAALPRLAYRSARSTLVPDMIQRATIAVSKTQGRRERIIERGNSSFITDWPSSTQVRNTTARWRASIYKLVWLDLALFLFIYYSLSSIYRLILDDEQKKIFEAVVAYCNQYSDLIPLSFVLGFYVSIVMTRWWNQYMVIPWPDSIAVFVSATIHGNDERGRLMRRTIVRYVCVCLTLVLTNVSPRVKKRFPTLEHFVDTGLLLENELSIFQSLNAKFPKPSKHWLPIVWASSIVTRARKEGRIRDDFAVKTLIDELNKFRGMCGNLIHYDTISVPLVYTQVVTLAVYTYFLTSVMGRQWIQTSNSSTIDVYFPVFTTLQFFFYMGWLKVAETLINPFGEDDDDFEVNWIIDRNLQVSYLIVDEMHHEHPELIRDQYWDEIFPTELPYTAASQQFREEHPEPSTAGIQLSAAQQELQPSSVRIDEMVPDYQQKFRNDVADDAVSGIHFTADGKLSRSATTAKISRSASRVSNRDRTFNTGSTPSNLDGSLTRVNSVTSMLKRLFSKEDRPDGGTSSGNKTPGRIQHSSSSASLQTRVHAGTGGSTKIGVIEEVDEQMTMTSMRPENRPHVQSIFPQGPPPASAPVDVPGSDHNRNRDIFSNSAPATTAHLTIADGNNGHDFENGNKYPSNARRERSSISYEPSRSYQSTTIGDGMISPRSSICSTNSSSDDEFTKLKIERENQRREKAFRRLARSISGHGNILSHEAKNLTENEVLLLAELADASRLSLVPRDNDDKENEIAKV